MSDETLRVACTQLVSSRSKEENLSKIEGYARRAKVLGAHMVVFPEVFMCYFSPEDTPEKRFEKAEDLSGGFVKEVQRISREHGISITVGLHERIENSIRLYNTTVTTDMDGAILNVYRKTHLYDAFSMRESAFNEPSDNPLKVFDFNGFKVGVMVCYEVRFPEVARTLALRGADLIVVPSAWVRGPNKEDQWLTLVKARALENTVYVATSNQIGNIYTGITSFVDPLGIIVQRAKDTEDLIVGDASKQRIDYTRANLPLLSQRRPHLYGLG